MLTRADPGPFLLLLLVLLQSVPGAERRKVVGRRLSVVGCRLRTADCRCLTQLSKALNYGRAGCQLNEQHVAATLPTQKETGKEKQKQKQKEKQKGKGKEEKVAAAAARFVALSHLISFAGPWDRPAGHRPQLLAQLLPLPLPLPLPPSVV